MDLKFKKGDKVTSILFEGVGVVRKNTALGQIEIQGESNNKSFIKLVPKEKVSLVN